MFDFMYFCYFVSLNFIVALSFSLLFLLLFFGSFICVSLSFCGYFLSQMVDFCLSGPISFVSFIFIRVYDLLAPPCSFVSVPFDLLSSSLVLFNKLSTQSIQTHKV